MAKKKSSGSGFRGGLQAVPKGGTIPSSAAAPGTPGGFRGNLQAAPVVKLSQGRQAPATNNGPTRGSGAVGNHKLTGYKQGTIKPGSGELTGGPR